MSTRSNIALAAGLSAAASALAGGVAADVTSLTLAPGKGEAMIVNTGSTNTTGYTIWVQPSGKARYAIQRGQGNDIQAMAHPTAGRISTAQSKKLFQDLAAAGPLSALPARRGMRSASFGTVTYIYYKDSRSPDLTLGGDLRVDALKADIAAICGTLHVVSGPRRPVLMRPVTPHPAKD